MGKKIQNFLAKMQVTENVPRKLIFFTTAQEPLKNR